MFSGIVEARSAVSRVAEIQTGRLVRVWVNAPADFTDLKPGDSVATDGVCLTVESLDSSSIQFAVAEETLAITTFGRVPLSAGRVLNLERSLRMGDRIHGHWVTGHVDAAAKVTRAEKSAEGMQIAVEIPASLRAMVWKKGSWAVNGVSLTVNAVDGGVATHVLIPETLLRTNLADLKVGDWVNVEVDVFARAMAQAIESYRENARV